MEKNIKKITRGNSKSVVVYDYCGNVVDEFDSARDMAKAYNVGRSETRISVYLNEHLDGWLPDGLKCRFKGDNDLSGRLVNSKMANRRYMSPMQLAEFEDRYGGVSMTLRQELDAAIFNAERAVEDAEADYMMSGIDDPDHRDKFTRLQWLRRKLEATRIRRENVHIYERAYK